MCVCTCIYEHVYMCMHMCVCIVLYMHMCEFVYVCTNVCVWMLAYSRVYVCICIYMSQRSCLKKPEGGDTVKSHLTWLLKIELKSSGRSVNVFCFSFSEKNYSHLGGGRAWLQFQHLGGRRKQVGLRPAWSTEQIPGHLRLHRELYLKRKS